VNSSFDELPELLQHLPPGFRIGVASAAWGVEGAAAVDGRTPSILDAVATVPGRTVDGTTGAVAADHYSRYGEDVDLLAELGVDAYRFSISWSRVQPGGYGPASERGLDFYDRLIDRLLAAGIDPWVTVYHWDLPIEVMEAGGWLDRSTAHALADLAGLVSRRIGDRVSHWITMADPVLHMGYGHALGVDAPGLTLLGDAFPVSHHLLLGHGLVREVLAQNSSAVIGIANHHTDVSPAGPYRRDRIAAALYDAYHNGQFAEPILAGRYPRLLQPLLDRHPGVIAAGDLSLISAPLDFYGVNYFHPTMAADAPDNASIPFALTDLPGVAVTDQQWPIRPESLTAVLQALTRRYPGLPPLVVTENGADFRDVRIPDSADGEEEFAPDSDRIAYLRGHLRAIHDATAAGVDVRGYFHRGLTDAWEGSEGFTRHFGLVGVDRETGARRPRASFAYLQNLLAEVRDRRVRPASGLVEQQQ